MINFGYSIYPKYPNLFSSWKHAYIKLTPETPVLYSKTGVYRGKHYFFLFLLKTIDCGYSLEPPHRGGSNEYPQSMIWAEIWKISVFLSESFHFFLVVKFSVYLNRLVFVMLPYTVLQRPSGCFASSVDPDHTPRFVASDLGLHC